MKDNVINNNCNQVTIRIPSTLLKNYKNLCSGKVSIDDGLPALICFSCEVQLNNAFCFKQLCETSDLSLRDYAKSKAASLEAIAAKPVKREATLLQHNDGTLVAEPEISIFDDLDSTFSSATVEQVQANLHVNT